jgi:hypothetical protein
MPGNKNGYIAIEAEHYNKAVNTDGITWTVIPDYGNTLSGVTPFPVTAARKKPGAGAPHLEYNIDLKDTSTVSVTMIVSPTLDFRNKDGLFYAVSIDDGAPQLVNIATKVEGNDWAEAVSNNARKLTTRHKILKPGRHVLKYWIVDPGVVLQKLLIDTGGLKPSTLGPVGR